MTGTPDALPEALPAHVDAIRAAIDLDLVTKVLRLLDVEKGVIIAGRSETDSDEIRRLAELLGWPVLADHRSGCRDPESGQVVQHFDSLLRDTTFAANHRPDVVLRIGEIVSSKATSQWLSGSAAAGTTVISSRPHQRLIDPESIAALQFDEVGFIAELNSRIRATTTGFEWRDQWIAADKIAAAAISSVVAHATQPNEIAIAQAAVAAVPAGGALVLSSSMPVRDVEWFGPNRNDISVLANRGANGIDGVVATALGVALAGHQTVCLIGDVAFLHDSTSLIALRNRPVDLTVVVTDNDGGGIFSFLPQHDLLDKLSYEELFGTPHGTDLPALIASHGLACDQFDGSIAAPSGVRVVVAPTDRSVNLDLHNRAHRAVAEALQASPS